MFMTVQPQMPEFCAQLVIPGAPRGTGHSRAGSATGADFTITFFNPTLAVTDHRGYDSDGSDAASPLLIKTGPHRVSLGMFIQRSQGPPSKRVLQIIDGSFTAVPLRA